MSVSSANVCCLLMFCLQASYCRRDSNNCASDSLRNAYIGRDIQNETLDSATSVPPFVFPVAIGCTVGLLQHAMTLNSQKDLERQRSEIFANALQQITDKTEQVQAYIGTFKSADGAQFAKRTQLLKDRTERLSACSDAGLLSRLVVKHLVPHIWRLLDLPIVKKTLASEQLGSEAPQNLKRASELCRLKYMKEQSKTELRNVEDPFLEENNFEAAWNAENILIDAAIVTWIPGRNGEAGTVDVHRFSDALNHAFGTISNKEVAIKVFRNKLDNAWFHAPKQILMGIAPEWLRGQSIETVLRSIGAQGAALKGATGVGFAFIGGMSNQLCKQMAGDLYPAKAQLDPEELAAVDHAEEEDRQCSGFTDTDCSDAQDSKLNAKDSRPAEKNCKCKVGGMVRFGGSGDLGRGDVWWQRLVTDNGIIPCTKEYFGLSETSFFEKMRRYRCECLRPELVNTESADSSLEGWDWCATSNRSWFTLKGLVQTNTCICTTLAGMPPSSVRFGSNGRWVSRIAPADGKIECKAESFEDVGGKVVAQVVGTPECYCKGHHVVEQLYDPFG